MLPSGRLHCRYMLLLRRLLSVTVCSVLLFGRFLSPTPAAAAVTTNIEVTAPDGSEISTFAPFADVTGTTGSYVAADLGSDGISEIIVSAGSGTSPIVRIFRQDGSKITEFYAYDPKFMGGVTLAACDVNKDGKMDIVTGAGSGGGPHVRVFHGDGSFLSHFFAFDSKERKGVLVKCGDVDGDKQNEIVATSGTDSGKMANVFSGTGALEFAAETSTITVPEKPTQDGITLELVTPSQSIVVDISEQRLRAYENGVEVKTFLISSGKKGFSTPLGKTEVIAKIPVMTYAWNYGAGNPNNYYLPNVKWNLRFRKHYYIHSAYWHNNFGRPMSHGCINTSVKDAEWIYNWAQVGATVEIVP